MRKAQAAALPTLLCLAVLACDRAPSTSSAPASSTPSTPPRPPVIAMDSSHNATMGGSEVYVIPPTAAVTLDPRGATLWENPNHLISLVEILHSGAPEEAYRARWDSLAPVTLDASNLSAVRGASRFPGFVDGDSYYVLVGGELPNPNGGTRVSSTWAATVAVRSGR